MSVARSLKVLEHYHLLGNARLLTAEISILCPWHQEETPSCHIWLDEERFKCFGCGKYGDLADLVCTLENVDRLKALVRIQRIMKDAESEWEGELGAKIILATRQSVEPQLTSQEVLEQAKGFFFSLARPSWDDISHHYLIDSRGFTPRTLKQFDVKINSSSEYPIIFPVYENGMFCGYMTRALDNREDKYRISKGMRKTQVLYGRVLKGKPVIVTEGAFDAMKTWQNLRAVGLRGYGIASPLNWSASDQQIEKLSVAGAILAAFDNDEAGRQGYEFLRTKLGTGRPVVRFPIPTWIHDMAELESREFQAGLAIACKSVRG